jgi:hypothetical protein
LWLTIYQFVFPERVICVLCEKILCLLAEDFLQLRVLKEEERKIAPQINSGDGVKKVNYLHQPQSGMV